MATTLSNQFTVRVVAPANSWPITEKTLLLSNNSWSQTTNPVGASTVGYVAKYGRSPFVAIGGGGSGDLGSILPWSGKAMWDPTAQKAWYMGGWTNTPGDNFGTMTMIRYDPVTDTFEPWQGLTQKTTGLWYSTANFAEAHCFDGADIDITNRRIYRALPGQVGSFSIDNPVDVANPVLPISTTQNFYGPLVVFPAMGAGLIFRRTSTVQRFSLTTQQLLTNISLPVDMEVPVAIHHDNYVYFTRGLRGLGFYRMDPAGNVVQVSTLPVYMCMDYSSDYAPNHYVVWGILQGYLYGFHCNGTIYRVSLSDPTYTWAAYGTIPFAPNANPDRYMRWSTPIPVVLNPSTGEGVFIFVNGRDYPAPHTTHLWRP